PSAMSKRRLKALVVDDEKHIRALIIGWLFREGFLCNEADDGAKALRELEHTHYDLVVVDLRMPNRHGHSLCKAILDQDDRARLVVVTGVSDPRIWRDLEARGVDHVFQKPVDPSEFVRRVRELTQSSDASAHSRSDRTAGTRGSDPGNRNSPEDSRMPAVALLMHDGQRAHKLAVQLKRESLLPFVPESSDALCELAENRHLEMLILENSRFGFLTPEDLVGHLKTSATKTEIILLGEHNVPPKVLAEWAIVPTPMSRYASDAEVVQAVRGKIAAIGRAHGRVSAQARELVRPLAVLSQAHQSALKLSKFLQISAPEPAPDCLAEEVTADANSAAEILRLAKGASAGLRGEVTSVMDAITRMGVTRSTALLVSSAIKGAEKPLLRRMPLPLREWYQRRSTLNAALAAVCAQKFFGLSGDVSFVLGLLQDIGIAVLAATFQDRYARLVARARSCGPAHLHVIEREDLRLEHSEISTALIEQWGFSDELLSAIRFHHNPKPAEPQECAPSVVDAMRIAESIADLCDNRHPARRQELFRQLAACCDKGPQQSFRTLEQSIKLAVEIAQQFRASALDEAALTSLFRELLELPAAASK
ncbi:MAG TPA: HDOD domain-containing protein, partial [Planctomycetaceae bacterium]|nr:HDOD domain-containing protein [Planctomycetaceae bacterium]